MINRTSLLRTAALSLALLAPSCYVYAEDATSTNPFQTVINFAKTVEIDETYVDELKKGLADAATRAQELYKQALACSDTATCEAIKKQLAEQDYIRAELSRMVDILYIQRGLDDEVREFTKIQGVTSRLWIKTQLVLLDSGTILWNSVRNFAKAVISRDTYKDAWQVIVAPDTLLGKAEILWNYHKPAVVGAAIVATAVTACIVYRDKIKAGLNRLKQSAKFAWDVCKA